MSEKTQKKNPLFLILCIVLAVAVILAAVLFTQRANLADQVDALTSELSASRTAWETTAAEKESLQAQLTSVQNDLREAQTSLEESSAKIAELEPQIASLQGDVSQANLALGTATNLNAELQTQLDALTAEKAALEITVADLTQQVETLTTQLAETEADLANLESTLASSQSDVIANEEEIPAEEIAATVNGKIVSMTDVDEIAQNMLYTYSQYGYDVSSEQVISQINAMALEYAVQLEIMAQKAAELGLDQMTDEDLATAEAAINTEWENLISTYITYYVTLADDASEEDQAAARETAIAGLQDMGYTYDILLEDYIESIVYDRVEAYIIGDALVTDEDLQAAFDEHVAADQQRYAENIASYEYMTQYYGQTSYYQPEGYRGIIHILLNVDDSLLSDYQAKVSAFETQDTTATDTDLVTQEDVDAAYAAILASVQPTIDEIQQKLQDGTSFEDLIVEYGQDPGMQSEPNKSQGYAVHADSVIWDPAFVQAAFSVDNVGDIADPVIGNYGVHIVKYHRDIPAGAVELTDDIRTSLRTELESTKANELFNAAITEWMNDAEIIYPETVAAE